MYIVKLSWNGSDRRHCYGIMDREEVEELYSSCQQIGVVPHNFLSTMGMWREARERRGGSASPRGQPVTRSNTSGNVAPIVSGGILEWLMVQHKKPKWKEGTVRMKWGHREKYGHLGCSLTHSRVKTWVRGIQEFSKCLQCACRQRQHELPVWG